MTSSPKLASRPGLCNAEGASGNGHYELCWMARASGVTQQLYGNPSFTAKDHAPAAKHVQRSGGKMTSLTLLAKSIQVPENLGTKWRWTRHGGWQTRKTLPSLVINTCNDATPRGIQASKEPAWGVGGSRPRCSFKLCCRLLCFSFFGFSLKRDFLAVYHPW